MSTETCNNNTGVLPAAGPDADDDVSADQLWASFALGLAAGGRVRIARDGRNYRRGWERRVDPAHRPVEPAAVRVYDAAGDTTTVAFDLDVSRASRQAVLRDCTRLTQWLTTAGCAFLVDESPTGGRHVYATLTEPRSHTEIAALAVQLRSTRALPTLDPSPLINRTEGCIRTPGAAHARGGHQRLITPIGQALAALHHRTPPDAWQRFLVALPTPPPTRIDHDLRAPTATSAVAFVGRLPLTAPYDEIATTGRYPDDRYPSPSEARAAVLMHALHRGWTPSQISDAVATTWTGLAQLYRNKYGTRYSPKALAADIDRAHARYTEHPLQISHTSASHPRGGSGAAASARTHLRRFVAAIDLAIAADRWGRRSFGAEIVLIAIADAARRRQSTFADFGIRHLSMGGGTVLDPATVAAVLRVLRDEQDPFLLLVQRGTGVDPDIYELRVPDDYIDDLPTELPPVSRGIHPVIATFDSIATYRVLRNLGHQGATAPQIATLTRTSVRTVRTVMHELRAAGLARRNATGWFRSRRSLDTAATKRGVRGRLRRIVTVWRTERAAWRAVLGLPPRVYSTRPIAWPGSAPLSAADRDPRQSPPPPSSAMDPATDPTTEAIALLAEVLGAIELPEALKSA